MLNEYFIYKIITTAIMVSVFLYWKRKAKSGHDLPYNEPKETTDGKFAVEKHPDDDVNEVVCEEIRVNPEFKTGEYSQLNINTNGNNNDLGDGSSGVGTRSSLGR